MIHPLYVAKCRCSPGSCPALMVTNPPEGGFTQTVYQIGCSACGIRGPWALQRQEAAEKWDRLIQTKEKP